MKLIRTGAAFVSVDVNVVCGVCVASVVHTMSEGEPVCGVTSLGVEIYLLRPKASGRDQVEVYDAITYRLQRCVTVPNARRFVDMASCEHCLCLYISDNRAECIHRLNLQGNAQQWPVNNKPACLSVNADHNIIVTCDVVLKIKEFNPRGELVRHVILPGNVINPWHAIQLTSGQFIVCHGDIDNPVHRVCKISPDGLHVVQSHGGHWGSDTGQYDVPGHLAVDDNEFVFVADVCNRRVTLLSPTLKHVRQVVSRDHFKWRPRRLCLEVNRGRLYVVDNEDDGNEFIAGRVVVFSV